MCHHYPHGDQLEVLQAYTHTTPSPGDTGGLTNVADPLEAHAAVPVCLGGAQASAVLALAVLPTRIGWQ